MLILKHMKFNKLIFLFFNKLGMNSGNGYVIIHPCRLHCSPNATCRFRLDNAEEVSSYCACPDGQAVGELQECISGQYTNHFF